MQHWLGFVVCRIFLLSISSLCIQMMHRLGSQQQYQLPLSYWLAPPEDQGPEPKSQLEIKRNIIELLKFNSGLQVAGVRFLRLFLKTCFEERFPNTNLGLDCHFPARNCRGDPHTQFVQACLKHETCMSTW